MIDLDREGDVFVLHMRGGENRFAPPFLDAFEAALEQVEKTPGPAALVTTGEGKFYSNGLDMPTLAEAGKSGREGLAAHLGRVHRLFARVLAFPRITVAAINGHAFAGGAMLATAFDHRIMREDRGYWCLPEVDLGLPLTTEMYDGLAAHLPRPTLAEAALTGRRYTGPEALTAGIVTEVAPEDEVLERAVAVAAAMAGKNRTVIAAHKQLLYGLD